MKHILITGANGFVGKYLLRELSQNKNISICALVKEVKEANSFLNLPVTKVVTGNLENIHSLKNAFSPRPDAIVHLAAVIKSLKKEDYLKNIQGTENLVYLAQFYGVKKFIFLSSDFVLYNVPNAYGDSKRKCEEILYSSNLEFTIFRPTPIYGPGDNKNFANLISVIKKYPILPAIKCYMEPVYVGDVTTIIIAALQCPHTTRKVYNLPGGSWLEFREIINIISKLLKLKRLVINVPRTLFLPSLKVYEYLTPFPFLQSYQVKKWLKNQPLDASLAKKELNYQPIAFEEGMRITIEQS